MTKTKFFSLVTVGLLGYIGWAVMVWFDPSLRPDFLHLHVLAVTGVVALVLRDMPPPSDPTAPAVVPTVSATPAAQPNV